MPSKNDLGEHPPPAVPAEPSNSKRTLKEIEREIDCLVADLRSNGWNGILTAIAIGERLIEGATRIPVRWLGRWEKAKWGWSKTKTARLRRFAEHAPLIVAEYNKGTASGLPDSLTIMGVYTWAQKATGEFKARPKRAKRQITGNTGDTDEVNGKADTPDDIAALRRQLREALNRIKDLEEELARRAND